MKKSVFKFLPGLFSIGLLILFSASCSRVTDYNTVHLESKTQKCEATLDYPQFTSEKLSEFNKVLAQQETVYYNIIDEYSDFWDEMHSIYENSEEELDEELILPYYYDVKSEVTSSGSMISVIFYYESYSGGAHGLHYIDSITWDVNKNRQLSIEEASGLTTEEISRKCIEELKELIPDGGWIEEGAGVDAVSSMKFSCDKDKIFVHFSPYDVAAYVYGAFTVEIK